MTGSIADRLTPDEFASFMAAVSTDNASRPWDPADEAGPDEEDQKA